VGDNPGQMDQVALYCSDCMRFVQYADEPAGDTAIAWLQCDRCFERRSQAQLAGRPSATENAASCMQCGRSFTPNREWHVFDSASCRWRWWRDHRNGQAAA
jgi:hypothetical protein